MKHDYIVDNDVIGRYRSGQLSAEEVAAFEVHLIECDECCALLDADVALERGLRGISGALRKPSGTKPGLITRQTSRQNFALVGIATIAAIGLAIIVIVTGQASPQVGIPVFELSLVRGTATETVELHVAKDASWYAIDLEAPLVADGACCRVMIEDADGRVAWDSGTLVVSEARRVRVLLHRDFLSTGTYRIEIRATGPNGVRLVEHQVLLRIER
jgi:anti-sigma factor RsiW